MTVSDMSTLRHLRVWCEQQFPGDAAEMELRITMFLDQLPEEDAAYLVAQGWWRVYDVVFVKPQP